MLKGRSNCFLIIKDKQALIIDTGRKNKRAVLVRRLERFLLDGLTFTGLILTHTHFDHAENAAYLKQEYKLPIFVHREEAEYLTIGENPQIRGSFWLTYFLTNVWENKLKTWFNYEPAEYDYIIQEKFDLNELGFNAYILHTPGHSKGSMSIIVDDEIAIVGDAMFGVIKRLIYPPFANDPDLMIKSWGKLLDTGCKIFLPAHGTENSREVIERQYVKYRGS